MKISDNIILVDMDSTNVAKEIVDTLGLKPGDMVKIMTPQFERIDGLEVPQPENTKEFFDGLRLRSDDDLSKLGLQVWDSNNAGVTWLFPHEWYDRIPEGFEIHGLSGEIYTFAKGVSDDDMRFGALPYGIFKKHGVV